MSVGIAHVHLSADIREVAQTACTPRNRPVGPRRPRRFERRREGLWFHGLRHLRTCSHEYSGEFVISERESIPTIVLNEPSTTERPGARVILLPTAHVGTQSALDAKSVLETIQPDVLLLEVCDERINGVMERLRTFEEDVMIPSSVRISGLPTGMLPGGVREESLLARLNTKRGSKVSRKTLEKDAELLVQTGLFEAVHVHVNKNIQDGERALVWREGMAIFEVSVSEIFFTVKPVTANLTSNIHFAWNEYHASSPVFDSSDIETRVVRRAAELLHESDCGGGQGEMEAWQTSALHGSLLLALQDEIDPEHHTAVLDANEETSMITLSVQNRGDAWKYKQNGSIVIDTHQALSLSFSEVLLNVDIWRFSSLIVAILRKFMSFVEMATTSKLEEKDGAEIVAGLSTAFEMGTARICLSDLEMSKTFELLEEKVKESAPGTKRSLFCYFASSLRALLQVNFKTRDQLLGAIETERLELMHTGAVDMPPAMHDVFIKRRDDVMFDCLWKVASGEAVDRPCFQLKTSHTFEYSYNTPALDFSGRNQAPITSSPITILMICGAAHIPGIVKRWNSAMNKLGT